ncbi:MAG: M64 family metallopeptidase, partial [Woeseiaceae bacterium]
TPWPKAEFEEHSIAVQERRAAMRAADVPEGDMNALFNYTKEYSEGLFSKAEYRDVIGAFEGANYEAQGYYRSEQNCIMFTRVDSFCQVCAAAIEKVIDEYTLGPP